MDVREAGQSGQQARPDDDDDDDDPVVPEAWRSKPFRLMVMAAVVVLTAGFGFGAGKLAGVGNNVVRSDIPKPETTADPFIEGSGSIADNSHANILSTTAPGLVHVLSGGKSVGIGLVLTQSGRVLTTYQPATGARNLSARYVLSGATFKATVIGTDPAAGLALLQMASSPGWPFVTAVVGNSDRLVQNAKASSFTSYHVPGKVDESELIRRLILDELGRAATADDERATTLGALVCDAEKVAAAFQARDYSRANLIRSPPVDSPQPSRAPPLSPTDCFGTRSD